jgi:hypothetical protein
MRASVRHQRIAADALVFGIRVDRLHGRVEQDLQFVADAAHGLRIIAGEPRELPLECVARRQRLPLGFVVQAEREVGQPVLQFAERGVGGVGGTEHVDVLRLGVEPAGVIGHLGAEIQVHRQHNQERRAEEQREPGPDRQW